MLSVRDIRYASLLNVPDAVLTVSYLAKQFLTITSSSHIRFRRMSQV
jgi:hypothetical protein